MTGEDFREIVLGMHSAVEGAHMGHPDFRANGVIFASLRADEASGVVKLPPDEQQAFLRTYPKVFAPATGAWGRQGWTVIQLKGAETAAVRGAVIAAWQHASSRPRTPSGPKPSAAKLSAAKPSVPKRRPASSGRRRSSS